MAYADYTFYVEIYKPVSAMPESEFEARAERASDMLDYFTFGRAKKAAADGSDSADAVRKAVCALAETSKASGGNGAAVSTSFTTDGYSESRSFAAGRTEEQLLYDTARVYLRGTGLLSRVAGYRTCC